MSTDEINSIQEYHAVSGGEGIIGARGGGEGSCDGIVGRGGGDVSDRSTKHRCGHDDNDKNDDDGEDDDEDSAVNCWGRLKRKSKLEMSDGNLSSYFEDWLRGRTQCPNYYAIHLPAC